MKVLLAGGTGLIGEALAKRLAAEGHNVVILTRKPREAAAQGPRHVRWDGASSGPWEAEIDGAEAVVNLAGESVGSRWARAKKNRITESRIRATGAIVRAIRSSTKKPGVLVNASAVGFYGHVPEGEVTEAMPPGDDFLGTTCAQWETEAQKAGEFGTRVVLMRTGFVIAREAEAFRRLLLPFKLFTGGPFGSGNQWFPWIHLEDVVSGYAYALEHPKLSGPANLTSPNPVRVKQLAKEIGKALHRPSFLPAPAFALKLILGEMSDLLLKGQKAVPLKLKEHGFVFKYETVDQAIRVSV
ncbi:MAG: epimerase [Bacteroidia bacterium]|nr:MAG: epimerase [Bacteroidia bacterium]